MYVPRPMTWLDRLQERLLEVLLFHPAELSEFLVGFLALGMGSVMAVAGSSEGTDEWDLWGGLMLAGFGAPQMVSAIHGGVRARHASNMLGCFAALANLIRTTRAEAPVAMLFYFLVFFICAFFWGRTNLALHARQHDQERDL